MSLRKTLAIMIPLLLVAIIVTPHKNRVQWVNFTDGVELNAYDEIEFGPLATGITFFEIGRGEPAISDSGQSSLVRLILVEKGEREVHIALLSIFIALALLISWFVGSRSKRS